jgi:hypothetical protein
MTLGADVMALLRIAVDMVVLIFHGEVYIRRSRAEHVRR